MIITYFRWKPNIISTSKILLSINTDGDIISWHIKTGKVLYSIKEKKVALLSLDYNTEGSFFAIGCEDQTVRIYDENMKIISHKIPPGGAYSSGHMSRINSVCFHKSDPNGNFANLLASGGWDRRLILYDIRMKKFAGTILGPYVMGDSIDMKDNYLLSGSCSPKANFQIWDIRNLKQISQLQDCSNINCAQFSKGGKIQIATGSSSMNELQVYDVDKELKYNLYMSTRFLEKPCYTLDFSRSGNFIAFSGVDSNIRIVNL